MATITTGTLLLKFQEAARKQQSVLTPLEKRCLRWLALRMPPWVNSDHLTALGFLGMFLAGLFYAGAGRWPLLLLAVNLALAVNWFGDSLDGTLARVRNRQRPRYGFYVDHMVDAFGALFVLGGLALSGYMSPAVALALLIIFYLLIINIYLATYTRGTFVLSFGQWGPTELRILLALGNIVALIQPRAFGGRFLFFDAGGVVAAVVMAAVVLWSVAANTRALYLMETPGER